MEQQTAVRIEKGRGALTIFASYFSGTGKTFRMLEAATQVHRAGGDVVIGCSPAASGPRHRLWRNHLSLCPSGQLQRAMT